MHYTARLYGPGIAAEGVETTLRLERGVGQIDEPRLELRFEHIRLRNVGFSAQGIEIGWQDAAGTWALQVLDANQSRELLNQLRSSTPAALRQLAGQRRGRSRRAWLGGAIVGLIILLVVAALWTLVAGLEPLATWAATHVSPQQERQLGEQSFKNMVAPSSLRDNGESARVLRAIGRRITEGSRYQYEFHVVDNPDVNAFALPGGIVVVNTGLIGATKRPEELAGVIAHEVQHVELQHGLRQIAKQFGFAACLSLIAGNLDSNLGGKIAAELVSLKFSRSAEQQADERAIAKLAQVGIDPNALPQFFRRLAAETAAPEWLSSHPATTDRQQKLEALIRAHAVVRSVPLEYGPWPPSSIR